VKAQRILTVLILPLMAFTDHVQTDENDIEAKPLILVIGATGRQGGAVSRELLQRGFKVRALTRNPNQPAAHALVGLGAQAWQGNMDDRASMVRAMNGVYGVFSVQTWWGINGLASEIRQGKLVAEVAKQAGVQHFVYTSVASADQNTGIPHFESKWQIEQHIRVLKLPYTIVRPVSFMDGWEEERVAIGNGSFSSPMSADKQLQEIAVRDIGMIVGEAFDAPTAWIGKTIEIAGDEYSMAEAAATFSHALGHPVTFERVPWTAFEEAAGEEITIMFRWFDEVGYSVDIDGLRAQFPKMTGLEKYLQRRGWAGN